MKIYISATQKDLLQHFQILKSILQELSVEIELIILENFGSQESDDSIVNLNEISKADVFIGIYANRYEYHHDAGKSQVELEYLEAKSQNIPTLIFVLDNEYRNANQDTFAEGSEEEKLLLNIFKARLEKENVKQDFTSPEDLAQKVVRSLMRLQAESVSEQEKTILGIKSGGINFSKSESLQISSGLNIGGSGEAKPSLPSEQIVDKEDSFGVDFDDDEAEEISLPSGIAIPPPKPVSPITRIDDLDEGSVEPEPSPAPETHFTAYYPRQVAAKTEYGFYVYAHLLDALIETDIQAFSAELGGRVPKAVVAEKAANLQEGALLAVMIQSDKLKFNQVGAMQAWKAPFVRFDFKFTADESLIDEIVEGRVAILLGMIEIASIDFKLSVGAASPLAAVNALPAKPTLSFPASDSVPPYQKIFVSYSRKDSIVAEQYRAAQTQLGNTIFMDVHTIRAGEDWEEALKRFVREADVFQLFWSEHSASSDHVRFEWDYALKQRCPETLCRQFIRPTYWQKPMPNVPTELNHLHFAYVEVQSPESKTSDSP